MTAIYIILFFSLMILGISISIWRETRYAIRTNFALSNKELVLTSSADFYATWGNFLQHYFPYYRNLDKDNQLKFCNKTREILRSIDIVGKDDLEINEEMRVLLAATIAQLTFGLKINFLHNFTIINVYPSLFYAKAYDGYIDSLTLKEKSITLSWQHFELGILNEKDGNNLGLRELSYALERTIRNGNKFDLHFGSYINQWLEIVKTDKNQFKFLAFIGLNDNLEHEVFPNAVCMFFENTFEFKEQFPSIYAHLCLLLNQNPLNITANYSYQKNEFDSYYLTPVLPQKVIINYKHHNWHWIYNLLAFCPIFVPLFVYLSVLPNNIISLNTLFTLLVSISLIVTVLLNKYNKHVQMFNSTFKLFGFSILGLVPLLLCVIITINSLIPIEFTKKNEHQISCYRVINEGGGRKSYSSRYATDIEVSFTDNYLEDCMYARRIDVSDIDYDKIDNASVCFYTRRGIFGIEYITKKEVVYNNEYSY